MDVAANIFPRMVNRFVRVVFAQSVVRGKRVSEHLGTNFDILTDFRLKDATARVRNVLQFDFAATFQKSHDNLFANAARPRPRLLRCLLFMERALPPI